MLEEQIDATAASSTATEGAPENPSLQDEQVAASSPESEAESTTATAPEKVFADTVSKLEEGKSPKEAAKVSEATTDAKKDEPAPEQAEEPSALSQPQEEALNKAFDERPEWKKALSLTSKEKQKEMRQTLRGILERETNLSSQIESQKPVIGKYERFKKAAGDDQSAENTVALMELFQQGNPKAREMLLVLLKDLDTRTGAILTAPDLVQRAQQIDEAVRQGTIDEAEATQRKSDLLELQKSRIGKQQSEAELKARDTQTEAQKYEAQQTEMINACNTWEKEKMGSDPDYTSLKPLIEDRAYRLANARQQKLDGRLLNGAEMREVLVEALKQVKAEALKLQPKPKARQVLNGNGSSAISRREPATKEEAFSQEIERLENRRQ